MHAIVRIGWAAAALLMATVGIADGKKPAARKPSTRPIGNRLELIAVKPVEKGRFWYDGEKWWAYRLDEGRAIIVGAPGDHKVEFEAILPDGQNLPIRGMGPYLDTRRDEYRVYWIGYLKESVYDGHPSIVVRVKTQKGLTAQWPLAFRRLPAAP